MGGGGFVAGSNETKANSAQFQVKLPTGAELGNIYIHITILHTVGSIIALTSRVSVDELNVFLR